MSESAPPVTFSVIIPAYNYARYLPRAFDSILVQENRDYEIVVVDDGSTDNTGDVVRTYQDRSKPRILYVFQGNRGPSAARNHGVRRSSGMYLFFLDADDALMTDALERLRCVLATHGHVDFLIGGRIWVNPQGKERHRFVENLSPSREQNFARYVRGRLGKISPGSLVVHRNVFASIRYPEDTRIGEDWVFNAHLLALFTGVSFREPIVKLFRHAYSQSGNCDLTRRDRLKSVDLLFDPAILPARLMPMRDEVFSLTYLAMFVFFYRRGEYREAKLLYQQAIRSYPRHILKWKHLRKYLRTLLGFVLMGTFFLNN